VEAALEERRTRLHEGAEHVAEVYVGLDDLDQPSRGSIGRSTTARWY
jgi:hypothetical protein